jgi:hypothetical protein
MKHFDKLPFGRKDAYIEKVQKASLEKIAQLIKVCSFLLQTKVYLFWQKSSRKTYTLTRSPHGSACFQS